MILTLRNEANISPSDIHPRAKPREGGRVGGREGFRGDAVGQHATRQPGKEEWQEMCKTCAEVGNKFFLPRARFDQAEILCHLGHP